ncbi:peptidoglycan DD-metalloendopeptidase family protein [Flavobacterium sp.]|uniref:peptidoglycan DD-metalloendopeptidase family protein n=1 Tax=Flavobacterium sp. TaxID=239 RepID=UPI004034D91F
MAKSYYYIAGAIVAIYLLTMKTGKAFSAPTASGDQRLCDTHGCGSFGASRGSRKHSGIDYIAAPGENIYSPISGKVTRFPYPYAGNTIYKGIQIENDKYIVKIFYMVASLPAGAYVATGQKIGVAQNIAAKYSQGMTNHVHFEIWDKATGKVIDPTKLIGGSPLNYNLVLEKGMKNLPEVVKLQEFVQVSADGIFGPQTEAALMAKKGVKKIALKDF